MVEAAVARAGRPVGFPHASSANACGRREGALLPADLPGLPAAAPRRRPSRIPDVDGRNLIVWRKNLTVESYGDSGYSWQCLVGSRDRHPV